ncbi:MAG: SDR family oxidoreductase [Anaerolineales bacterium]|nr:SDR family oxidoreductase [Anaerolineales bacterium]
MRVLFIGGTGVISSACSQLAVERGIDLYLLNRGWSSRPAPERSHLLQGDIRDVKSAKSALGTRKFDAVVDWIAFTPEHVEADLELFRGRTEQYIYISSASAYQKPPAKLPVTESTPLENPYWEYSQLKIACEQRLMRTYREGGFPVTIVRPSHTYDRTLLPMEGKYTVVDRMRKGKKVIVHGDGSSLWVLTNHRDFAKGFVGLLGNNDAIGQAFHITSDDLLTWNQIFELAAQAAGVQARIVHIPSDFINAFDKEWGASLIGDKAYSMIFDNTKIKRFVPDFEAVIPFSEGVKEIMAWYDADPRRQIVDEPMDRLMDKMIALYESLWPSGTSV